MDFQEADLKFLKIIGLEILRPLIGLFIFNTHGALVEFFHRGFTGRFRGA